MRSLIKLGLYFLSLVLFINFNLIYSISSDIPKSSNDLKSCVVTAEGNPSEALKVFCDKFDIKHDGTFKDIVDKVRDAWKKLEGDLGNFNKYESEKENLRSLFEQLGLVNSIDQVSLKKYKYAIVPGGFIGAMCSRINYLKKFWEEGVRFEKIIILTGQRDFVTDDYSMPSNVKCEKNDLHKTESEAIKFVFDKIDLPADMKELPVTFVDTPKQKMKDGSLRQPFTQDKIRDWSSTNPEPGDCLVVCNQPYVRVLDNEFYNLLSKEFQTIEVVGYAVNRKYESVSFWFQALSWWLCEEKIRLDNQK
jgi:hypothetical protein